MAKDLRRKLGRRIRELRLERGWTQEQLAEHAELSWHHISGIERSVTGATVETLVAIATALDVSLSELLLGVDRPAPRELRRLSTALAGCSAEAQQSILRIVEEALRLGDHQ